MTLQEILKSFNLNDDQMKQTNTAVTALIDSKLDELKSQMAEKDGNIQSLNDELAPHRESAKNDKLNSLMPDNVNPDAVQDLIAVSGLEDEDDDETIKTKLSDSLDKRPHLQKTETEDPAAAGSSKTTETTEIKEDQEDDSDTQDLPQGIK